jgi:hypothetical protein
MTPSREPANRRAYLRTHRAAKRAQGICTWCTAPSPDASLCDLCAAKSRATVRVYRYVAKSVRRCHGCGLPGHNRRTCTVAA